MTENTDKQAAVYRDMDQATLDAAYNNSAAVTDSQEWVATWRERSERSRNTLDAVLDIRYGKGERNVMDLFLSGQPSAPLFVFIHGGYWMKNDKSVFSFIADGLCERGIDVVVPSYTLAPQASLSDIVAEIHQALAHIRAHPDQFPQDLDRMVVGGWSAGGHLSALTQGVAGVAGVFPISAIFDLEPIALTYLNDTLQLSTSEVSRLSPIHVWPDRKIPLRIAMGALELPEMVRQSSEYADAALNQGRDGELLTVPEKNHFSILEELFEPDGALAQAVVELCASVRGDA